jgi:hypothetical protein
MNISCNRYFVASQKISNEICMYFWHFHNNFSPFPEIMSKF